MPPVAPDRHATLPTLQALQSWGDTQAELCVAPAMLSDILGWGLPVPSK